MLTKDDYQKTRLFVPGTDKENSEIVSQFTCLLSFEIELKR